MYRNQYDTDCTTWSPEGRIYQTEYACEAVKQGTCGVGIKSKSHVVVCGLRRNVGQLATHNEKVMKIDDFIGTTFSGITADGKILVNAMRSSAMNHRFVYEENVPVLTLIHEISARSQELNQTASKRPFGVGLLIAGCHPEKAKTYLIETSPSGDFLEYKCQAFGSRAQSANTYLDKILDETDSMGREDLIKHALLALQHSLPSEQNLDISNVHVGVVGLTEPWSILTESELEPHIKALPKRESREVLPEAPEEE